MWNQWNIVFRKTLGQAERTFVSELRDVRNRWAHQNPFSTDDAYRAAVKAISEGEREFDAIAVVTEDGGTPCGECRQVLHEFGADIVVILADTHGHYTLTTVGELLPKAFTLHGD